MARRIAAACATLAVLAACSEQEGPCPYVRIPPSVASVTKFNGPVDPKNVIYQARIADVALKCTYSELKRVNVAGAAPTDDMEVLLKVRVAASAGPKATGNTTEGRYFVAVADVRDVILDRQEFPLRLQLGQGGRSVVTEDEAWMLFRLKGRTGAAFRIYTGFQLSTEEADFNRKQLGN
ncbi:MAG: hypothetical protein ACKVSF_11300 [Alphaproteobacteria bacterium]